jgi:DNA polymerase-1
MIKFIGNNELYKSTLYEKSTLNECLEWLNTLKEVNLDTETEGMFNHCNKIVMLQLNWKNITYVIDVRYINIKALTKLENILVVGQNLKFDYKFLKFYGIELNNIYDTFLAECCLTNGLKNRELSLDKLAKKYSNKILDKSVRSQFIGLNGKPFTEKQIFYGVQDVECLTDIKTKQLIALEEQDLLNWFYNECDACLALADIEYNGIGLDKDKWLELAKTAKNNTTFYTEELDQFVRTDIRLKDFVAKYVQTSMFEEIHIRDINIKWSSPLQVEQVFKKLNIPLDEGVGERFLTKYQTDFPIIKKYIDYKKQAKLVTTYGKKFLNYVNEHTGKIHTSFWQIKDTSRVSSGSKKDNTPNMQNIPANNSYRNCFIPSKGKKIVSCDFSGQELRLTAFASEEKLWINAFKNNEDLHSNVAAMVFKIPLENVRDKPDFLRGKSYRDAAKTVNFGLVYGMSKFKLADTLNIPVDEADIIIKNYFKATPQLNNWLQSMRTFGITNGYIRSYSPYRIKRLFPKWKPNLDFKDKGEIERASMNTPIQSSGGQMCKRALVLVRDYIKLYNLSNKVKIIMTVHDQIDCEVDEDYAEEWSLIQKSLMERAGSEIITNTDIPVLSEITISNCWQK